MIHAAYQQVKPLFILSLLLLFLPSACMKETSNTDPQAALLSEIEKELAPIEGEFAVVFRPVSDKPEVQSLGIAFNEETVIHAASTMKVPVMIEVFRQAAEGRFSLDSAIRVHNSFSSLADGSPYTLVPVDDSETDLYQAVGQQLPIRRLVFLMITVSSNLATNLLIELVGVEQIQQTMRNMGLEELVVLRGVEDIQAFRKGMNNTVTARALANMLEQIARGKAVSPEASAEMMAILERQVFREMIPARLPATVRVGNKTGFIRGVEHDAGIVVLPDGRQYVLVLLSRNLADPPKAVEAFARISEKIYHYALSLTF